jgi:hypothetical protein
MDKAAINLKMQIVVLTKMFNSFEENTKEFADWTLW